MIRQEHMELEQAREIRNSSIWAWIECELDYRIKAYERELRYVNPDKLVAVQEKIQALEELKDLPNSVVEREDPGTD